MIRFKGFLKDTGHPIKIDSDGQAEIIFSVPASDLTDALPIVAMGKRVLIIGIIAEEENEDEFDKWLKS